MTIYPTTRRSALTSGLLALREDATWTKPPHPRLSVAALIAGIGLPSRTAILAVVWVVHQESLLSFRRFRMSSGIGCLDVQRREEAPSRNRCI